MSAVRTRFAPSPTGYMHIGGMRTALFNWLWARHNKGTFILRIDDTDQQRNIEAALGPILQAFRWLGLEWDEGPEVGGANGPYYQSQRGELYRASAERLLGEGKAYRDFETPEEIKAQREAAEKEKRPYLSSRSSLEFSSAQIEQYRSEGRPHVVRFLVPRDQKVATDDHVRGRVEWDCALMPDPVILRADGSPLYNFATVVDDAAMQITHVIRAEEHLSNTPVQVLIHQALGNELPEFAHVPFVSAPGTTKKLSKRDIKSYRNNPKFKPLFDAADQVFPLLGLGTSETLNPVMVEYYEKIGYLPEGVLNALARLGWSLDDKTEIMSRETIVENFTLDRVVKSPAGLDPEKLLSFQQHWMGQLSLDEKIERCLPYLVRAAFVAGREAEFRDQRSEVSSGATVDVADDVRAFVQRLVEALGERLRLFSDVLLYPEFFQADDEFPYDEKAFDKRVRSPGSADLLAEFKDRLAAVDPWEPAPLEAAMKQFVEEQGIKIGEIIHPVRIAVTGKAVGPGMFDCLALLGRKRTLRRIERTLGRI